MRRAVTRALALRPRGFVRDDVLKLGKLSAQLRVEWRTRDLHPWDLRLPPDRRANLFRDQSARDTDAAIHRFFATLPELDVIDIRVLAPREPHRIILAGRVSRAEALAARSLSSARMRLRMMGIHAVK